ncbi:MAG: hypothetical protein EXR39_14550 [Betaproteobacteria bacterium]|nr:hypothetical protein [Betaproteobacteria bacterium]
MSTKTASADTDTETPIDPAKQPQMAIQLTPSGSSDMPVFTNFTNVSPGAGMAVMDFGFLDPQTIHAVTHLTRSGKKAPNPVNGRLASRVVMNYDTLANLHQQIGRVIAAVAVARREQAAGATAAKGAKPN